MLKYTKANHRFFDDLVTFLASIASMGIAFEAQCSGGGQPFKTTEYLTLEGKAKVSNVELRFFPHLMMQALSSNSWPVEIMLEDVPLAHPGPSHPFKLTGLQGLHGSMIESAFVHYFETVRPVIETKYGNNPYGWPTVWNFARVVRNAFAHKGEITFINSAAQSVSWKTLTYSPSDNGRQILYQDVTPVEIILLMEEMDQS